MTLQQIPLTNEPNQNFQITLDVNGTNRGFGFDVRWNEVAGYWVVTLTDLEEGEIIIDSLPLVTGKGDSCDILRKYGYLKVGIALFIPSVKKPSTDYPNTETLGEEFILIWNDNL